METNIANKLTANPQSVNVLRQHFEEILQACIGHYQDIPEPLYEPIRYVLSNGGKRVRPLLVYLTGQLRGIDKCFLDSIALAVELIHIYSLVHDDLPAMDNDDLRRGKPTCHKVYGDDMAILTGDALQAMAYEQLLENHRFPPSIACLLIKELVDAAGARGMVAGQALDIKAQVDLDQVHLTSIHELKTQRLLLSCINLVNIVSDDTESKEAIALVDFAKNLGLAFQVRDDILDVIGTTETLGKPQGSDLRNDKTTFCHLLGLDEAKAFCDKLHHDALEALEHWGDEKRELVQFATQLLNRSY